MAEKFYKQFIICLNMTNTDMVALFLTNFFSNDRETMEANGFCIPQRPYNKTRDMVYQRIVAVKEAIIKAERGVNTNFKAFMQMQGMRQPSANRMTGCIGQIEGGYYRTHEVQTYMGSTRGPGQNLYWSGNKAINSLVQDSGHGPNSVMMLTAEMTEGSRWNMPCTKWQEQPAGNKSWQGNAL
eukprot:274226-Ditylum_brightwellii.AAC.1